MTPANCIVYIAVNKINGKRYVGFTSRTLARRSYEHVWEATRSPRRRQYVFHKAIRSHGAEAFEWAHIASGLTRDAALLLEAQMVALLRPEYNSTAGGDGSAGRPRTAEERARQSAKMKGRRVSPEAIAKIVAKNTGRKRSPEQRERIAASRRGKPFSETHKAALRVARVGRKLSMEHRAAIGAATRRRYAKGGI